MRSTSISFAAAALALALSMQAEAQTIGLAAPLSDDFAILGEQMEAGGRAAASRADSKLLTIDTQCTAEGGEAAARRFLQENVSVVVGFLCTEAIEAALPLLTAARIPVITPGIRTDSLTDRRDRTGWSVFRLGPRADGEQAAVADILPRLWRDELFAIVDDGTIYGRELSETFRFAAEQAGLEPVFVDTYRPQLDNQIGLIGRLRNSGATHVFAGGDRADIAIMARDAAKLDYDLTIAGGDALRAAPSETPLAEGILMIGLPAWADVADPEIVQNLREAGTIPEGYVLPAYAATEVAIEASRRAASQQRAIVEVLTETRFETVLGTIDFDEKGDLVGSPYGLFRYDGDFFLPMDIPE